MLHQFRPQGSENTWKMASNPLQETVSGEGAAQSWWGARELAGGLGSWQGQAEEGQTGLSPKSLHHSQEQTRCGTNPSSSKGHGFFSNKVKVRGQNQTPVPRMTQVQAEPMHRRNAADPHQEEAVRATESSAFSP